MTYLPAFNALRQPNNFNPLINNLRINGNGRNAARGDAAQDAPAPNARITLPPPPAFFRAGGPDGFNTNYNYMFRNVNVRYTEVFARWARQVTAADEDNAGTGGAASAGGPGETAPAEESPETDPQAIRIGDRGAVNLFNTASGEMLGVSFDSAGNVHLDYSPETGGNDTAGRTLDLNEAVTITGPGGQSLSITATRGSDWDVDATGVSGVDVIVDGVGYGSDHVNVINEDNGEQTSFWLGCLIQDDELATQGDDIATIRLNTGSSIQINGDDGRDRYRVTAGGGSDWDIVRSDGERGWFFYTGNDIINVFNTDTGKTTSFMLDSDMNLTQLDEPVTDGDNVTTYNFTPGTDLNIQPGGHNMPTLFRISAKDGGDWNVRGVGRDGRSEYTAQLGEGDVVRVDESFGGASVSTYYKLIGGELEEVAAPGEDADDVTAYFLSGGDVLRIRADAHGEDLATITGRGDEPAQTGGPGGGNRVAVAGQLTVGFSFSASVTVRQFSFRAGVFEQIRERLAGFMQSVREQVAEQEKERNELIEKLRDADNMRMDFLSMLLDQMKNRMKDVRYDSMQDGPFRTIVDMVYRRIDFEMTLTERLAVVQQQQ